MASCQVRENLEALRPDLFRRAMVLCNGDVARAEDLVQDTMLRALDSAERFRSSGVSSDLKRWVYTIMRNRAFTLHRDSRAKGGGPRFISANIVAGDGEIDLYDTVVCGAAGRQPERLIAREGFTALNDLPPQLRGAVLLAALGYEMIEIAEMTGVPVGTAKSRVFRGRKALQASCST